MHTSWTSYNLGKFSREIMRSFHQIMTSVQVVGFCMERLNMEVSSFGCVNFWLLEDSCTSKSAKI